MRFQVWVRNSENVNEVGLVDLVVDKKNFNFRLVTPTFSCRKILRACENPKERWESIPTGKNLMDKTRLCDWPPNQSRMTFADEFFHLTLFVFYLQIFHKYNFMLIINYLLVNEKFWFLIQFLLLKNNWRKYCFEIIPYLKWSNICHHSLVICGLTKSINYHPALG